MSLECLLQTIRWNAHLLRQRRRALEFLHQPFRHIKITMRLQLGRSLRIQDQPDRAFACLDEVLHLCGHRITPAYLINKARAGAVDKNAAHTAQSLGGQELGLGVWVGRVDEPGRVDLNLVHVAQHGGQGEGCRHAVAVASSVVTIRRW